MDLIQAAWMIRDIGQPVSSVHICEDASVIAGGWNGALKKWDQDGAILWSAQCNDRIESILIVDNLVVVTSGLHVTCLLDGEIQWSHPLEGSADMLTFMNGQIIATSSVYDIEHGDFMESAIWRFSLEGELIQVDRMDERPWFIHTSDELIVGLGRPKCGVLIGETHQDLATESPVTCGGYGGKRVLFGHADGTISSLDGATISKENSSIESLHCTEAGFTVSLESGDLVSRDAESQEIWTSGGEQITTQSSSFEGLNWCGRKSNASGSIEVRGATGDLVASAKTAVPRVSTSSANRIAFGFEDGQILIWEKDLFERRSSEKSSASDGRRSALAARLRSLRE